jgi:outer membrane protein TolC
MIRSFLFFSFFFIGLTIKAQAVDTLYLTQKEFLKAVYDNHPLASQARLLSDFAKQQLRFTRGGLDPSIKGNYEAKNYKDSRYYEYFGTSLELPFWLGDLKAGFDQNSGSRISNDRFTVDGGVSYLGLSLPVLQGLVIDERRNAILQAKAFQSIAEAERIKLINKLLLSAAKDYWDWAFAYERLNLLSEAYGLAFFRFNAIRERAIQGDAANVDTLEAYLQVQNFDVQLQQASVDFSNMGLMLSTYLWDSTGAPGQLLDGVLPTWDNSVAELPDTVDLNELMQFASLCHPELIKIEGKLEQLQFERKLAIEKFKPRLDLNYNLLFAGNSLPTQQEVRGFQWDRSAKFGLDYKIPIIFRAERAKYQLAKIKIQETEFERSQTNRQVLNNVETTFNELVNLFRISAIQTQIVANNLALREAEQRRFDNGESSLFIINVRDVTLVNSRIKLFELRAKYAKNLIALQWAAGRIQLD